MLLAVAVGTTAVCFAQPAPLPAADAQATDARVRERWPRVWAELQWIQSQGTGHGWATGMQSPARALPGRNLIQLNPDFLDDPAYPPDRWLIVVWHEYGHILFHRDGGSDGGGGVGGARSFEQRVASERAAFAFSVKRAIEWNQTQHDPGPLREVVKNLRQRAEAARGKPPGDPHPPAIRQLMGEPLWREAESLAGDPR